MEVPASAFVMVLTAALLHASWNVVLKASPDRLVAAAAQSVAGALVLLPFLVDGGLPGERLDSLILSAAFHLGYGLTLIGAYGRGDLSVVYPVARGSAPLTVTLGAFVWLDESPTLLEGVGVVLVAAGLVALARGRRSGLGLALVCGGFIAGYTLVDGAAVRAEGGSLRYTAALFLLNAIVLGVVALTRRGVQGVVTAVRVDGYRQIAGGVSSAVAYLLVLIAVRSAPLASVAALREVSVVIGAVAGWLVLGESFGRTRVAAAAVVATGAALLVLG